MDDFYHKPHRREAMELNIVPILDMLVCMIFFLLLTTTFMNYTKLTLPPSGVSTITDPVAPPPLNPKLIVTKNSDELRLILSWAGSQAGQATQKLTWKASKDDYKAVIEAAKNLVADFSKTYPKEKAIQVGLTSEVPYQVLISVMDGVRPVLPDVVLFSYAEAEARAKGAAQQ